MAAHQAPPSLGFSRQEHWSGLPFPSPMHESEKWKWSHSVMSDSLQPNGLQPTRPLRPWDFPGKSTGVGCHCLLWYKYLEKVYIQGKYLLSFLAVTHHSTENHYTPPQPQQSPNEIRLWRVIKCQIFKCLCGRKSRNLSSRSGALEKFFWQEDGKSVWGLETKDAGDTVKVCGVRRLRFDPGSTVCQSPTTLDALLIQEALCASVAQYLQWRQKNT